MTIKGDMEAMLHDLGEGSVSGQINADILRTVITNIMDWLASADVLALLDKDGTGTDEWLAGVNAVRNKIL